MKKMTYAEWKFELEELFNKWLWARNKYEEIYLEYLYHRHHKEHWFFCLLERIGI